MQLHWKTAMNHRESSNRFAHFCLISWFVVRESKIRADGRKRAIDDENPAGPFVYGHCLLYSTPSLRPYIYIYIHRRETTRVAQFRSQSSREGWTSILPFSLRGNKHLTARPYFRERILRFYLRDRHFDNGGCILKC